MFHTVGDSFVTIQPVASDTGVMLGGSSTLLKACVSKVMSVRLGSMQCAGNRRL